MTVPLFDPSTPLEPLRGELDAAIARVLDSKQFILGPEVEAFESELATYLGARHAIGVANGTEALTIALRALGVGPGDDVVVPSFTFYASAEAIPPTGARPVFCDVDPATFTVTAETVKAAILRVQLPHLDSWADHRRQAAGWYADARLGEWADLPQATPGADPAWHLYVIRTDQSEDLERALPGAGIGARSYYRVPVHRQPAMAQLGAGAALPGTDNAARRHLAIPISAAITREQVREVVDAIARCASGST